MIGPYPPYAPIPALLPRVVEGIGRSLQEWATATPERPLRLLEYAAQSPVSRDLQLRIHTDLIIAAWRQLFPAERMLLLGGRRQGDASQATSFRDVTGEKRSRAYVKASASLMHEALMDWEAAGAHVVAWIHSHPGSGPQATHPSEIDRHQDRDLSEAYGTRVLGVICTHDGWLRLWGDAIDRGRVHIQLVGRGLLRTEQHNVYRLAIR